ncbi:HK97 family phage prohead protease [Sphingomonas sp. IW22]|uniref:HK97 family phage prohead protease n=1 Tax=Sphingomonas sp. IW22 TaxID=3242489 RepID=UPI00352243F6
MGEVRGVLRFAGYAAVFDRADRGGDVVRRGAFAGAGAVPLLWQHGGAPVGRIEALGEDARGLRVLGRVERPELARMVACGAVTGLSFGYRARVVAPGTYRELIRLDLQEVSLVAQPMQPLARITAIEWFEEEVTA